MSSRPVLRTASNILLGVAIALFSIPLVAACIPVAAVSYGNLCDDCKAYDPTWQDYYCTSEKCVPGLSCFYYDDNQNPQGFRCCCG